MWHSGGVARADHHAREAGIFQEARRALAASGSGDPEFLYNLLLSFMEHVPKACVPARGFDPLSASKVDPDKVGNSHVISTSYNGISGVNFQSRSPYITNGTNDRDINAVREIRGGSTFDAYSHLSLRERFRGFV